MNVHTPISLEAERIAAVILQLETTPAPELVLTPLGVRTGAQVEAMVIARLGDGGREVLSASDARFLARCLRADVSYAQAGEHADALDVAADESEKRASASYLTYAQGRAVTSPRYFGAWR